MASNKTIKLSDGRFLSYFEFGKPGGNPVFYFHGSGISSGLYIEALEDAASKNNILLIAPDRPGIGSSSYKPDRKLLDWSKDVESLANHLGISKFSIISESGGSFYAYACAHMLPSRINKIAIVSGVCPLDIKTLQKDLTLANRFALIILKRSPAFLLKKMFSSLKKSVETNPEAFFSKASKKLSNIEKSILANPAFRKSYANSIQNAFKQGYAGAITDIKILSDHWDFDLSKISCKISLWHGNEDQSSPVSMTKGVEKILMDCQSTYFPNEGHMAVMQLHAEEIFRSLSSNS